MGKEKNLQKNIENTELITEKNKIKTNENKIVENDQVDVDFGNDVNKPEKKVIEITESEFLSLKEENNRYKKSEEENLDKLKRIQADFDNYKKILQKDKDDYCRYAEKRIILQLLNIVDDFEITLNAIKKEIKDHEKLKGLEIISKKITDLLNKEEVKPIKSVGEAFDPFIHEVLLNEITDKYSENTILEEFKKGYYLRDKVLRPALVKIAKNK